MNSVTTDEHKMVKVVRPAWSISAMVDCTPPYSGFVTHADYRALEDENGRLKDRLADYEELCTERNTEIQHLREELASIKARVGELVAADHEYDICSLEFREAYNEGCDETEALADDLTRAASRRRLALESFT